MCRRGGRRFFAIDDKNKMVFYAYQGGNAILDEGRQDIKFSAELISNIYFQRGTFRIGYAFARITSKFFTRKIMTRVVLYPSIKLHRLALAKKLVQSQIFNTGPPSV